MKGFTQGKKGQETTAGADGGRWENRSGHVREGALPATAEMGALTSNLSWNLTLAVSFTQQMGAER